ncbi:YhdP family protein [Variovorax sp. J22G21]|uniref:YhdP family protein n=1 Tax=Variovorax fucosicus TaxID=3053517 RepID=UPI002577BB8C|nr:MULTISPECIES: YhdP family protein [unclassified Variovorax]MDM0039499.1 YhdP family protein [Variovorax sp. J22R193]MDM0064274.1 YhdP family protein [Variovorax sp. J22G21]
MNDTTSSPSRLLRITAVTARWILGLLIAAWLLFALSVVVLHGWIVPRIGDYRGALEAQASKAIGVPVRIGSITAESGSLFPSFELRDVVLHDAQQREALKLARVVASVSPRSLWRLNFEQVYVESPEVDVRRDAAGKLHVAGLDMSTETSGETRSADWFFSQREFAVKGGTVRWTDEQRGTPPILLSDVSFVARNSARRHTMRLDATPPEGWGQRFTFRGLFRQPLLSVRSGKWQTWDGQMYAELPYIDVTRLGQYVALDARIREGNGALRVWADLDDGQISGGALDLALARVDAVLGEKLEPLVLRAVTGRLAGSVSDESFQFSTTNLQFDTVDGLRWPGGNLSFQRTRAKGRIPERGVFKADRLDLAALAVIANRLPLDAATHRALSTYALRGLVERIDTSWQGPLGAPEQYQARGRVSALSIASQPGTAPAASPGDAPVGTPGVRGATIAFDATHAGGTADVSIAQGALELPGVFEEPVVPIDQLTGKLSWKLDGPKAQLQVTGVRFSNADAQGEAKADWRTSDPATRSGARFPGVLDLQGQLTRANGTRVFRYLPLVIPKHTRDYVRDGVTKGTASTVDFKVRGDLRDMPFMDPRQGEFRIAAKVADVTYAYVPPVPGAAAGTHWPALTGLSGELVFERAGMLVRNARGRIVGAPGIEVSKAEAEIADMSHHAALLKVDAQAKGPLAELLRVAAPVAGGATGEAAARARATGNADYKLRLELPLAAMDKVKLQASLVLADNELQPVPEAPPFTQARGTLTFTESGFALAGVQARLAGGEVKVEGRGRYAGTGSELSFKAQGTTTAEGLRAAREVGWLARLAKNASGSTPYTAAFSLRDGNAEFQLDSTLQGLALQLPAPLAKAADEAMPLRLAKKLATRASPAAPLHDELSLDIGRVLSARYLRDISGAESKVLAGGIGVGLESGESVALPARGVLANIRLARVDVDAWKSLFGGAAGAAPEAAVAVAGKDDEASTYLPTSIALRAQELVVAGRKLQNVVLGGSREGTLWRGNIDANDLSGYVEYRQSQDGRLYARLARLRIAPSEAPEVESLLDEKSDTLPALDIVVDDFELLGRRLGRAEISAVNVGGAGREWRLNKLNFTTPEGTFTAQGSWAASRARGEARRMTMSFKLDMSDAGALLGRFNMKDVVRRGRGRLEGEVDWRGSPFSLDYPSLGGQLHVDVESGQFLKADPGLAKLLGVLSLQALPRRLTLDFRDIFSQGFQFDFLRGDAKIAGGVASTNNLQMKGVNAAVLMEGNADIARETQSLHVVVVPEISAGTAALVATAINPAIGLATFLAQAALSRPLSAAATQEFQIDGTWADPKITKVPRKLIP